MNKILDLNTDEFQKTMSKMNITERESISRLLEREISLEKNEYFRYKDLLKMAEQNCNNFEISRNEQNIKDCEKLLEKLNLKLHLCQKEFSMKKEDKHELKKASNGPKKELFFRGASNTKTDSDSTDPLPTNTKSIINSYERISVFQPNAEQKENPVNFRRNSLGSQPSQAKPSLKCETKTDKNPVLFTDIKLKAVGLPPDVRDVRTNPIRSENRISYNLEGNREKNSLVDNSKTFSKSPSVDFARSSPSTIKKKFHNHNKDIQLAIQSELKELKLKKTNQTNPDSKMSIPVDISLGKFNFTNEKVPTNSSASLMSSISASKSMPFLHSISTQNISVEIKDPEVIPHSNLSDEKLNNVYDSINFETSVVKFWNPTKVLEQLYDIKKQTNENPKSAISSAKNMSGVIEIMPGSVNKWGNENLWKRKFATLSNGELKIYENESSRSASDVFEMKNISVKKISGEMIELHDSKGLHSTIRFSKASDCNDWVESFKCQLIYRSAEIVPRIYDSIESESAPKVIVVDLGSCSIRAGLLKNEPTFPKLFIPNIASLSKSNQNVIEVGFEAFNSNLNNEFNIIRPLKPDTTIEHISFTSGTVEFTFQKICSLLKVNPKEYVVLLSLPHNVAEATRTKLADVLLLRLNFKGVSMCGQSLLALHAYGEPTGVLVDIGYRMEILPVIHGIVQNTSAMRSICGGHLIQVALSHLLPYKLQSITDFLLARYIMEKACVVARSAADAENFKENVTVNLDEFQLPDAFSKSVHISGKERCLPVEGLFNPEIYSLDSPSLPKLIFKSIQSCPVDNRRDLYQSICLSGAVTIFPGFRERLESELKKLVPKNCDIKIKSSPNRAHFSYIGACFVALSERFSNTVVSRQEWENSRGVALKKWHV